MHFIFNFGAIILIVSVFSKTSYLCFLTSNPTRLMILHKSIRIMKADTFELSTP